MTLDEVLREQFAKGVTPDFLNDFMKKSYAAYVEEQTKDKAIAEAEEELANRLGDYLALRDCEDVEELVNIVMDYIETLIAPEAEEAEPSIKIRVDGKEIDNKELVDQLRKAFPWFNF